MSDVNVQHSCFYMFYVWNALKVTKFPCDYLATIRQVLTLREVEYLPATLRDGHRLKRQSSFCIIIHDNSC